MAWPAVYGLNSRDFDPSAGRQATLPNIILVHDAFHSPIHLQNLATKLRETGYRVLVPQLPSALTIFRPEILEADVQTLYEAGKPDIDAGRDIILVLHGYAGMPGSTAAERLNQYAIRRPRAGFVVQIVFVAAAIANAGECFLDITRPQWLSKENGHLRARNPELVFFQDCSATDARIAASGTTLQLPDSFRSKVTSAGWSRIPCVYVLCAADQAIPLSGQQACVQKLQSGNRQVTFTTLRCGHSPFLSHTLQMAALITQSARNAAS